MATSDADETLAAATPLAEQYGIVFGEPAEATDQNAFAVTTEFAEALDVTTLSELADACGDGSLTLGGPGECPTRPQCQLGLEETYGLEFAEFQEFDAGGPLTKAAIQQGEVSIGLVFSSDGALGPGLIVSTSRRGATAPRRRPAPSEAGCPPGASGHDQRGS